MTREEAIWDRLYNWLNDMRFGIAPDETVTDIDEKRVRAAQLDILDDIMVWMEQTAEQEPTTKNNLAVEWIPVSERLPEEYGRYLTYHADGMMNVGAYSEYGWGFGHYVKDVIAWMPLPEPYKAENLKQGLEYADQDTMMPAT